MENRDLLTSLKIVEYPKDVKCNQRFQAIALVKSGISKKTIVEIINRSLGFVNRWCERDSLNDRFRSGRPLIYTEEIQLKAIAFYCQTTPLTGCGRWTLRWVEKYLKENLDIVPLPISHSTLQRILKSHKLKPHLTKYFLQITDPNFFPKMESILSLYFNPPKNFYSFDECPGIQILQRLAPDLQTEEMKIRLEEFEYIRHGTMDVFAFLEVKSGKIFSECRSDHTTKTLLQVFEKHLNTLPENEPIHYLMDNLASHSSYETCQLIARYSQAKCPPVKMLNTQVKRREWLQNKNKRIVFHFTPFHGSWLNMVEIWFGILNKKCLEGSFDSPESIYSAINSFSFEWSNLLAHPFKWTYTGQGLHQKAVKRFICMLENNPQELTVKFMTKQFLLMHNLIMAYWEKVDFDIWLYPNLSTLKASFIS